MVGRSPRPFACVLVPLETDGGALMATGFTRKQWELIKARDGGCVWHGLGCDSDTWVPQHRAGRGMGGSKSANRLSNGVVLCSWVNGLLESDAHVAEVARRRGIKVSFWADPELIPVVYSDGATWLLTDDGERKSV